MKKSNTDNKKLCDEIYGEMHNYITLNIDTFLQDDKIKSALNHKTNRCTRRLMTIYDKKEAYIESLFRTYVTACSFIEHEIDKKN